MQHLSIFTAKLTHINSIKIMIDNNFFILYYLNHKIEPAIKIKALYIGLTILNIIPQIIFQGINTKHNSIIIKIIECFSIKKAHEGFKNFIIL